MGGMVVLEAWPTAAIDEVKRIAWVPHARDRARRRPRCPEGTTHNVSEKRWDAETLDLERALAGYDAAELDAMQARLEDLWWVPVVTEMVEAWASQRSPVVASDTYGSDLAHDHKNSGRRARLRRLAARDLKDRDLSDCYLGDGTVWVRIGTLNASARPQVAAKRRFGGWAAFELRRMQDGWRAGERLHPDSLVSGAC